MPVFINSEVSEVHLFIIHATSSSLGDSNDDILKCRGRCMNIKLQIITEKNW